MTKYSSLPPNLPPRGLHREAAASYIGISPSKFDDLVQRGQMPPAKMIDKRKVWDRVLIDAAFDELPVSEKQVHSPWDSPT